jgi:HEAT repeat protein
MQRSIRNSHWPALILLLAFNLIFLMSGLNAAEMGGVATVHIRVLIEKIKSERSTPVRVETAKELSDFLQHSDTAVISGLDEKVIDDLADLLTDRDDGVRAWAALSLGHIGAPAKRSVPALERALQNVEPPPGSGVIGPSLSSASAIRGALQRITGKPASVGRGN